MAINKLTQEQLNFIKDNYGKLKAREIATLLNVSINDIYKYWKKSGVSKQLNPTFDITERQRQILLGGIIGDGSFKKNGSNYYYRECHATPEAEYLMWKFNELRNMTTGKIYNIPRRGINQNLQVSFQTVNSPTFNPYALMSIDDVIETAKKALYTGHIGDGKIFVYDVAKVVKVRTGEEDLAALKDVE